MFESLDQKENSFYETSSGDSDSGIGYGYGGGNYDRNGGAGIASLFTGSGVVWSSTAFVLEQSVVELMMTKPFLWAV